MLGTANQPLPNTHLHTPFSLSCFCPHHSHILSCPHNNYWQLLGDRSTPPWRHRLHESARCRLQVTAALHLHVCGMCSQARSPSRRSYPPEGDEVGGDDVTLGENHVSPVQEGERDRGPPGRLGSSPFALVQAQAAWTPPVSRTSCLFSLPPPSGPCPLTGCVWCLLRGAGEAGAGGGA